MIRSKIISAALALIIAVAILLAACFAAIWVEHSRVYRQSSFLRSIVSGEDVSVLSIITDPQRRDMTARFIAALTNAYISFELIPHNEAQTFAAVFQSLSEGVHISHFEYRRHDLIMRGKADTMNDYNSFIEQLAATQRFALVTGHFNPTEDGKVMFEILCSTAQSSLATLI